MTKRQVQRGVERHVATRFPELSMVGDLLVAREGSILRGLAFERSQMDKSTFRLRAFAQLLSVPAQVLTFGLSKELGNFRIDGNEEAAFKAAAQQADGRGRQFLSRVDDCESLLSNLESVSAETTDQRLLREVRAHCLIRLALDRAALQELEALSNELSPAEVEYEQAALDRAQALKDALTAARHQAVTLLDRWTEETVEALDVAGLGAK